MQQTYPKQTDKAGRAMGVREHAAAINISVLILKTPVVRGFVLFSVFSNYVNQIQFLSP